MPDELELTLHSANCPHCSGLGTYKYPGGQVHDCPIPGLSIPESRWKNLGKPRTIEEYLEKIKERRVG